MQNLKKVMLTVATCCLCVGCGDKLDPLSGEENDQGTENATDSNNTAAAASTAGTTATQAAGLCNTGATQITYNLHAKKVFTASCSQSGCHSTQSKRSGISTDTYAGAKSAFRSSNAQDAVDTKRMPKIGSLTDDQICILDNWAKDGLLE